MSDVRDQTRILLVEMRKRMHLKKRLLWTAACVVGVLACSAAFTPGVSAAIKSAVVEIVLPSKPFFGQTDVTVNDIHFGTGTEDGTLGITNLVVTNFNNVVSTVEIFQPVLSPNASTCFGPITGGGGPFSIFMTLRLQPNQTLNVPFPTPLVIPAVNGHSCIAAEGPPGLFEVNVVGFVN
jgi:hypothetical protein